MRCALVALATLMSIGIASAQDRPRLVGGKTDDNAVRNQAMTYQGQDPRFAPMAEAIERDPGAVAAGHRRQAFPANAQLWREVLACRAPDTGLNAALGEAAPERVCFVCSIDDVGGLTFAGKRVPPNTVAIHTSYAFLRRDDEGRWALADYEPFGSNRYARNGALRNKASVRWIREAAIGECYDLQAVAGRLNIY